MYSGSSDILKKYIFYYKQHQNNGIGSHFDKFQTNGNVKLFCKKI